MNFIRAKWVSIVLSGGLLLSQCVHAHYDSQGSLGEVAFNTSCDEAVHSEFNRAVAFLHSFEYDKAAESFTYVARQDDACAMAYWGIAMSYWHPLWAVPTAEEFARGRSAVEKARALDAKTQREQAYIDAIALYYDNADEQSHVQRASAYEAAMAAMHKNYPNDSEAALFYALALLATASPEDKSLGKQKQSGAISTKIALEYPDHPGIAHYIIHAYDSPELAHLAIDAARKYSAIAPASAHAQHMPSHIFTRQGMWRESVQANLTSTQAAIAYAKENNIDGAWDEELHGLDYLIYAYLQMARDKKAYGVLEHLSGIQNVYPINFKSAYSFAAIPARYTIERRRWADAATLSIHPSKENYPWHEYRQYEAVLIFARAVGAAKSGKLIRSIQESDELAMIELELRAKGDSYWANQVKILHYGVEAWMAASRGRHAQALELLVKAADLELSTDKHPVTPGSIWPAQEQLGDLLMDLNQPKDALIAYESSLKHAANRYWSLYGAAQAAEKLDDQDLAQKYYRALLTMTRDADTNRPEIDYARRFLAAD